MKGFESLCKKYADKIGIKYKIKVIETNNVNIHASTKFNSILKIHKIYINFLNVSTYKQLDHLALHEIYHCKLRELEVEKRNNIVDTILSIIAWNKNAKYYSQYLIDNLNLLINTKGTTFKDIQKRFICEEEIVCEIASCGNYKIRDIMMYITDNEFTSKEIDIIIKELNR